MPGLQEQLLQAILAVNGRQSFPPDRLAELISPKQNQRQKLIKAFNLCDGTRSQADVAKELKLDSSNFSGTVTRWLNAGILFRLGEGRGAKLLHVYPLSSNG